MMTIGKIAREAGVGIETIRFYERKGLLTQPKRKPSQSFRAYAEDDARRVRFIKRAQDLGFTLKEISQLLELNHNPEATCEDVRLRAEAKLEEVTTEIRDLRKMKRSLEVLVEACEKSSKAVACCRITDCFDGNC